MKEFFGLGLGPSNNTLLDKLYSLIILRCNSPIRKEICICYEEVGQKVSVFCDQNSELQDCVDALRLGYQRFKGITLTVEEVRETSHFRSGFLNKSELSPFIRSKVDQALSLQLKGPSYQLQWTPNTHIFSGLPVFMMEQLPPIGKLNPLDLRLRPQLENKTMRIGG